MNNIPDSSQNIIRTKGAMGAKVTIKGPERNIYLLTCKAVSPEALIRENGGKIVMKLTSMNFLVTLSYAGYVSLKYNPSVVKIGPVTVDTERFEQAYHMLLNMIKDE